MTESSSDEHSNSLIYNMLGSATAGLLARIPVHPLDTCKAKLQVQQALLDKSKASAVKNIANSVDPHHQSRILPSIRKMPLLGHFIAGKGVKITIDAPFRNSYEALIKTFHREGVVGLYRGLVISMVGSCPAACLYFTTYEYSRRRLSEMKAIENRPYIGDFIGGFAAETVSCILWVPIDVIKERMQVQSAISPEYRYRGVVSAMSRMYRTEGFRSLFRAYGATIASFGPFSALYLTIYESLKKKTSPYFGYESTKAPGWLIASCASMAGAVAAFTTNPLDMVKLRMQVQRGGIYEFGYNNIVHGMYRLITEEGIRSTFHGAGARVAFWVPNLAVSLTLYETMTRFYRVRFKGLD